jgi:hypothetical protein
MLDLEPTVAKGRPKLGAPLTRAISTMAEVGGFGVEIGLADFHNLALNFKSPQIRAIKNAGEMSGPMVWGGERNIEGRTPK